MIVIDEVAIIAFFTAVGETIATGRRLTIGATGMKSVVAAIIYDFDGLKLAIMSITDGKHFGNLTFKI